MNRLSVYFNKISFCVSVVLLLIISASNQLSGQTNKSVLCEDLKIFIGHKYKIPDKPYGPTFTLKDVNNETIIFEHEINGVTCITTIPISNLNKVLTLHQKNSDDKFPFSLSFNENNYQAVDESGIIKTYEIETRKQSILNQLNDIAVDAQDYRTRDSTFIPRGDGKFLDYTIPHFLIMWGAEENIHWKVFDDSVNISAVLRRDKNSSIRATITKEPGLKNIIYTGIFK
jgi:hypothetical protein